MTDDARLDHGAARAGGDEPVGLHRRALAAAEPGAVAGADRPLAGDRSAGPLGGGERLRDEGSRALRARRADAAWPDAEIVLVAHGREPAHRAMARICLMKSPKPQAAPVRRTSRIRARKPLKKHNRTERAHRAPLSCHRAVVLPCFPLRALHDATGARQTAIRAKRRHRGLPPSDRATNRPDDCGAIAKSSRAGIAVGASFGTAFGLRSIGSRIALDARDEQRRAGPVAADRQTAMVTGPERSPPPKKGASAAT